MNKTAIKNFAIWARNKLIADITYKSSLMGITADGIKKPLPQSTVDTQLFDIGTKDPYALTGKEIHQRGRLVNLINQKSASSDYKSAYQSVIEEIAYTWFNRLIAIRFMEVNDYLSSHIRVLSSDSPDKLEPDIVTDPFDTNLEFTSAEESRIIALKTENKIDELFQLLFVKQCNALNECLPMLFEKTEDYTELLLNISVTDHEGVVYHLIHDIPEDNFNVNALDEEGKPIGQVEIIGWLYQYYNTEPKDTAFAKKGKITKEEIPAVTQLFTPDWIVRYMVENSVGRIWIEHLRANDPSVDEKTTAERFGWKYYLPEAKQEPDVQAKLDEIYATRKDLKPEDITCLDPAMGSGHILVYMFEVLMQIYKSAGYAERDAAISILEHNIYGLDIDDRAFQLSYFALIMKARQYNRTILRKKQNVHVYAIQESNDINYDHLKFIGNTLPESERKESSRELKRLLGNFKDAKIYGSIIKVNGYDFNTIKNLLRATDTEGQISAETLGLEETLTKIKKIIDIAEMMQRTYMAVSTNPPYMSIGNSSIELYEYVQDHYSDFKSDLFSVFIKKCSEFMEYNGYQAMITMHAWMFLPSYEKARKYVYERDLISMIHLGTHAFSDIGGEVVQTAAFIRRTSRIKKYVGIYFRLVNYPSETSKEKAYLIKKDGDEYIKDQDSFNYIPGAPVAYWASNRFIEAFINGKQLSTIADSKQGLATADNDHFLRLWFEVNYSNICFTAQNATDSIDSRKKWFPYNKGGEYCKWFGNDAYVVNWKNDGEDIKADKLYKLSIGKCLPSNSKPKNTKYYFLPNISWSKITTGGLSFRYKEAGQIFDSGANCLFASHNILLYLAGLLNSKVTDAIIEMISPTINTSSGVMNNVPVLISKDYELQIEEIVNKNIQICKENFDQFETSWNFKKVAPNKHYKLVKETVDELQLLNNNNAKCLLKNEENLNDLFINLYGLQDELIPTVKEESLSVRRPTLEEEIKLFLLYAVGCMFGRYSLDVDGLAYAGGEWDASKYSTFIPDEDNVIPITDEEYFDDDIVGLFITWLKKVYGEETLEENLAFIAKVLGGKGKSNREVIRNYFLNDFFKDHCQTYSVTGSGKRPIYWLFNSGKQNGFKALIYMHRYNPDTLGKVRVDYLHRMEQIYTNEIARMQDVVDHSTSAHDVSVAEKRIEKLRKQIKECQDYDAKLGHLALDRIAIDLDDGVKINYRKVQTGSDGKFYEVLADSKQIMAKDDLWKQYLTEWHK